MSSIIKFTVKGLRRLAESGTACVEERRVTQSLALQPWCLANLKDSIKNLLEYKIGKFDKELDGILLSFKNLHVLQNIGAIRNDHTDIHFQVQADYYIFRPHVGATLRGVVNKKSVTHLGIIVHRVFNVVIPRPTEAPGSRWIGSRVREGQEVVFKIVVLDLFGALPYIRGELDERFLEMCPEVDDEPLDKIIAENINVLHVNYDKNKPHSNKQIGDGPEENEVRTSSPKSRTEPKSSSKSNPKPNNKNKQPLSNGKDKSSEEEKVNEKIKKQKRSRTSGSRPEDQVSNVTLRQTKKHKVV